MQQFESLVEQMGRQSNELRDKISEYFMDRYEELLKENQNQEDEGNNNKNTNGSNSSTTTGEVS